MTPAQLATLIRFYTRTNTTTFTNADMLILVNIVKDDICYKIGKDVGEDYFGLRFERDLIADQREYQFPSELMGRIKYLQAKLDGTNWERLNETDLTTDELPISETDIQDYYADKDPEFDIWDNGLYLLTGDAIIDVTDGLKLWAIIYPADLANMTEAVVDMSTDPDEYSHGIPKCLHELIARRVSIMYKSSKDKPIPLSEKEKVYEIDLQNTINEMKGLNLDRVVIPTVPSNDGSDY